MKAPVNLARHQAGITVAAAFGIALAPIGSQADVFTSAAGQATARQSAAATPTRTITGGSVDGGGSQVYTPAPTESTTVFTEDAPSGTTTSTTSDAPPRRSSGGGAASATGATTGAVVGPKGGMVAPPVEYAAAPCPVWTVEGGYQSKYIWRGLDTVQLVSWNEINIQALANGVDYTDTPNYQRQDSGVYFFGANMAWNGWSFGAKYVRSVEDGFNPAGDVARPTGNPFPFDEIFDTLEAYEEYIFSLNYTMALVPDQWLDATLGFDFYYYPEEKFWGAEHQGLAYLNFNMPRYQWAQPYINFFYNVETDSYSAGSPNAPTADLVSEGWGFNVGVNGGGQIADAGIARFGVSYGLEGIFKQGFEYEPDGFTHLIATLAFPIQIGENFTLTPSVSYVENLDSSTPYFTDPGYIVDTGYYDDPGWWWGIKATGTF